MQIKRADGELRQPIAPAGTGLLLTGSSLLSFAARTSIKPRRWRPLARPARAVSYAPR
jgi:hypothetical protein